MISRYLSCIDFSWLFAFFEGWNLPKSKILSSRNCKSCIFWTFTFYKNWFHVNSEWKKNDEFSTLCNSYLSALLFLQTWLHKLHSGKVASCFFLRWSISWSMSKEKSQMTHLETFSWQNWCAWQDNWYLKFLLHMKHR